MIRAIPFAPLASAVCASLLLTACTAPGDYPSLARRDAERIGSPAQPAPAQPARPVAADAAVVARLEAIEARAQAADARLRQQRARAESLVSAARGAAPGSEAWSVATVALSGLESARSDAMLALADVDALHATERLAHPNEQSGDGLAIAASRERVLAIVAAQDAVIAALAARMRRSSD
ncbi:MAG TPA: hypothetical protein PKE25_00535, partial [Novosphingobium sp.]|nr:hypothetical protein [Novosphingobium sp.]